jgi:hypothetical protein
MTGGRTHSVFCGIWDHHNLKKKMMREKKKTHLIIKMLDPKNGDVILKELGTKYPKK